MYGHGVRQLSALWNLDSPDRQSLQVLPRRGSVDADRDDRAGGG
jgi:hypothetical protein